MTTLEQLYYVKKGLKLKDVFVLFYLKKLTKPTTLDVFLKSNPLIDLNDRNLRLTISKLEELNFLAKFKTSSSLIFIFPFLRSVAYNRQLRPTPSNKLPFIKSAFGRKQPLTFYKYNYIYNIFIHKRHNVKNIKKNIKKHNLDDVNTYNIDTIRKTLSKIYGFKDTVKKEHNLVVTKNNFNFLSDIKKRFKEEFPDKNNYITCEIPNNFDYELFISKIKASKFLSLKSNLGLSWLIKNYEAIIHDCYANFKEKTEQQAFITKEQEYDNIKTVDYRGQTYTKEEFNAMFFDSLDDIEV